MHEPSLETPYTDMVDPNRMKLRIETEDPQEIKSRTLRPLPKRVIAQVDILEPRRM